MELVEFGESGISMEIHARNVGNVKGILTFSPRGPNMIFTLILILFCKSENSDFHANSANPKNSLNLWKIKNLAPQAGGGIQLNFMKIPDDPMKMENFLGFR